MVPLFVDTSAWYACCCQNDVNSVLAQKFLRESSSPLVTSNLVLAETMSLITKRIGKSPAVRFGAGLRASRKIRIIHIDAALEEKAWGEFSSYTDKNWDLVDCASFALMNFLKADTAFTFDAHFAQRGFRVVPGH